LYKTDFKFSDTGSPRCRELDSREDQNLWIENVWAILRWTSVSQDYKAAVKLQWQDLLNRQKYKSCWIWHSTEYIIVAFTLPCCRYSNAKLGCFRFLW